MYALLPYGTSLYVILVKLIPAKLVLAKAGSGDPDFSLAAYLRIPSLRTQGSRRNDKVSLRYEDSITY